MERQVSTAPIHDSAGGAADPAHSLQRNAVPARLVTITSLAASGPAASVALAIPVMVAFAGEAAMLALVNPA